MKVLIALVLIAAIVGAAGSLQQTPESRPATPVERAEALLKDGKFDEAVEFLREIKAKAPVGDSFADLNLARTLLRRAQSRRQAGDDGGAYADATESMALAPTDVIVRVQTAAWWREDGETFRAMREIERVLERAPSSWEAFEELARCRQDDDDLPGALECVVSARKLNPARRTVHESWEAKLRKDIGLEESWFRVSRGSFTVKGEDKAFGGVAEAVLDLLDAAAQHCGATLGHVAGRRVVVVVYGRETFRDATGAHGWTGGLFDGRIRLPVAEFSANRDAIARTLRHEYTHLAIQDLTRRCPVWLNEGLAQILEGRQVSDSRLRVAGKPWRRVESMPASWVSIVDADEVGRLYAGAHVMTDAMVRRVGFGAVRATLVALKDGKGVATAFEKVTGIPLSEIEDSVAGER